MCSGSDDADARAVNWRRLGGPQRFEDCPAERSAMPRHSRCARRSPPRRAGRDARGRLGSDTLPRACAPIRQMDVAARGVGYSVLRRSWRRSPPPVSPPELSRRSSRSAAGDFARRGENIGSSGPLALENSIVAAKYGTVKHFPRRERSTAPRDGAPKVPTRRSPRSMPAAWKWQPSPSEISWRGSHAASLFSR